MKFISCVLDNGVIPFSLNIQFTQHSYAKTKTFAIASWAFILFAIPWDITYLVFANDLQTHAQNYCYNNTEPVDLEKILGTYLTCDEIRLAPPVVGVITIVLLLLKVMIFIFAFDHDRDTD
jgi:hypothetical protein